jgi:hypothetical protein
MSFRQGRLTRAVKYGLLAITTEPWTNVRIGGRLLGPTPLRDVKLPVGPQRLSFENPALGLRVSVKVDVEEGRHTHRFMLSRGGHGWTVARHLAL